MTNLKYLEMRKRVDDRKPLIDLEQDIEYRKAVALEIIAEELCKSNELSIKAKASNVRIKVIK